MQDGSEEFVVLKHTTKDGAHWDLMLEDAGILLTWQLETLPEQIGSGPIPAHRIFDHPLRFLTYEGPVQQNTAEVRRVDKGLCRLLEKSDAQFKAHLQGTVLRGTYKFTQQDRGSEWVIERQ